MVKKIEHNPAPAGPAPAGPGHVEDLGALAREAAQLQNGEQAEAARTSQASHQAQAEQGAQAAASQAEQLASALLVGRDMLADMMDESGALPRDRLLAIWTDKKVVSLAGPLSAVVDRHGAQLEPFFDQYGPYAMLAFVALMPTLATVKAVRHHKALNVQAREVPAGEGAPGG